MSEKGADWIPQGCAPGILAHDSLGANPGSTSSVMLRLREVVGIQRGRKHTCRWHLLNIKHFLRGISIPGRDMQCRVKSSDP